MNISLPLHPQEVQEEAKLIAMAQAQAKGLSTGALVREALN